MKIIEFIKRNISVLNTFSFLFLGMFIIHLCIDDFNDRHMMGIFLSIFLFLIFSLSFIIHLVIKNSFKSRLNSNITEAIFVITLVALFYFKIYKLS